MTGRNGLSCLVVDDEPRLRRVIAHLLEGDGFRVREAGTGVEALREMEVDPAPLVISDLRMPEMDGVTLLPHLLERWPDTAVVMVSAVADVETAVQCLKLGALDYVSKPFNLGEVRARAELEARVHAQERRIKELFLDRVEALAQALEEKDAYLRGHSLRVAEYATQTARRLGFDEETIDTVRLGARLHDLGKIGVSEEILHKPAKLTPEEYRHIMEHTVIGARVLGPLLRDRPGAIAIVRSHHERVDGKGMPDGLQGDAIPAIVRIVSVADAFDAMTSERTYRHSLPVEEALDELRRQRGVQWDPTAVDGFLDAFPDIHQLPIPTPDLSAGRTPQPVG